MKIAFDARAARENVTGVGRIILETALGLSERNHEITLIYDGEPNFNLEKEKITKAVIGPTARNTIDRFFWEQTNLRSYLEKNEFDFFHAFWNFGVPFFYKKPAVLTVHDLIPKVWPGYYNWKTLIKEKPFYEISLAISVSKARKILVDSESTKNDLFTFFPSAIEKTVVCYAGVDHQINVNATSTNVETPEGNYFVYFGGMDARKNIDLLIEGFADVRKNSNAKLIVVGKHVGQFDTLIKGLGLEGDVVFPGFVSQESLEKLLSNSAGVVYPSSYEGFGFPILEAQKAGTAVITTRTSSLVELAADSCLMVEPNAEELGKTMSKLLSDRNLRTKLVRAGEENIKRFTWAKTVDQVEKIYSEVLNG